MRYAIISDVHANPAALEKVLADSARYGVEKVICAGDVVGYGPDPANGMPS
ncbi:MAG: metallophosphoesterase [Kiritimatiellae bacterium]|nr:metallophosphoesterase [Kiritimatiellia bacterium]